MEKIVQTSIEEVWMRPNQVRSYLGDISRNKYHQLVKDNAFPVTRPDPKGRLTFVRKSDIDKFLTNGYPAAAA